MPPGSADPLGRIRKRLGAPSQDAAGSSKTKEGSTLAKIREALISASSFKYADVNSGSAGPSLVIVGPEQLAESFAQKKISEQPAELTGTQKIYDQLFGDLMGPDQLRDKLAKAKGLVPDDDDNNVLDKELGHQRLLAILMVVGVYGVSIPSVYGIIDATDPKNMLATATKETQLRVCLYTQDSKLDYRLVENFGVEASLPNDGGLLLEGSSFKADFKTQGGSETTLRDWREKTTVASATDMLLKGSDDPKAEVMAKHQHVWGRLANEMIRYLWYGDAALDFVLDEVYNDEDYGDEIYDNDYYRQDQEEVQLEDGSGVPSTSDKLKKEPYYCKTCHKIVLFAWVIREHGRNNHPGGDLTPVTIRCFVDSCGAGFTTFKGYMNHLRNLHRWRVSTQMSVPLRPLKDAPPEEVVPGWAIEKDFEIRTSYFKENAKFTHWGRGNPPANP